LFLFPDLLGPPEFVFLLNLAAIAAALLEGAGCCLPLLPWLLLEVAELGVLLVGVITGVAALDLFAIEVDAVGVLKTSLLELSQFKLMFSLSKVKF
jgi:hypothetical protein